MTCFEIDFFLIFNINNEFIITMQFLINTIWKVTRFPLQFRTSQHGKIRNFQTFEHKFRGTCPTTHAYSIKQTALMNSVKSAFNMH